MNFLPISRFVYVIGFTRIRNETIDTFNNVYNKLCIGRVVRLVVNFWWTSDDGGSWPFACDTKFAVYSILISANRPKSRQVSIARYSVFTQYHGRESCLCILYIDPVRYVVVFGRINRTNIVIVFFIKITEFSLKHIISELNVFSTIYIKT